MPWAWMLNEHKPLSWRLSSGTHWAYLPFLTMGLPGDSLHTAIDAQGGFGMAQKSSFTEIKAEQARITESWKAEGRTSEAWTVADPEIVEIFSAGVAFGINAGRRNPNDPAYTPDEWRKALREAMEKAAALEAKLDRGAAGAAIRVKE
jgi:hypothetical protein